MRYVAKYILLWRPFWISRWRPINILQCSRISEKTVSECLIAWKWFLLEISTFYNAYNMRYGSNNTLKWRPFWNSKWHLKTCSEKMEPKFFGFSTPKLTKLANKINFGTKISRDFIVASTKTDTGFTFEERCLYQGVSVYVRLCLRICTHDGTNIIHSL